MDDVEEKAMAQVRIEEDKNELLDKYNHTNWKVTTPRSWDYKPYVK